RAATEQQDYRLDDDPWQAPIDDAIAARNFVTVGELLRDTLKVPIDKQEQRQQNRVSACLVKRKWKRRQGRHPDSGKQYWRYERPGDWLPDSTKPADTPAEKREKRARRPSPVSPDAPPEWVTEDSE